MNQSRLFRRSALISPRQPRKLGFDNLEGRMVLSTSTTTLAQVHALATTAPTSTQTLSGTITNQTIGKALRGVRVELLDSSGTVVQKTFSNARGNYTLRTKNLGAYIVREVTPKGYSQVTPTFAGTAPVGAYAPGKGATSWNYRTGNNNSTLGPVGPASWAQIAPAGLLPFESPVNITGPTIDLSKVVAINYNPAVARAIVNNGSQIQTQFAANGADTINLGGQTYNLSNFHYHDPAENQVNGVTNPMEEHFVNTSAAGATTVLAVFLQIGAHNNALDPILNAATASLTKSGSSTTIPTPIDFSGLLPTNTQGWYYQGSLTTPPLSQVVNWLVFATPITLDATQYAQYETVANGAGFLPNARPQQALDGRQFNEVDVDVVLQGNSLNGLNFGLAKTSTLTGLAPSLGSSSIKPGTTNASTAAASNSANSTTVSAQSLVAQLSTTANSTLSAEAASQGYQPVAGCNCPLCQMLRNATWHQVTSV